MADRENIIERIHEAIDYGVCVELFMDILELLKEQEDLGKELESAMELIHKKNKRIEDQQNVISALRVINDGLTEAVLEQNQIVRCKDCAYYKDGGCGNIELSSPCRNLLDVKPDWFCADGERK